MNRRSLLATTAARMVPVVGGKYKVWTKRLGGGPGFSRECLDAMESFLPPKTPPSGPDMSKTQT